MNHILSISAYKRSDMFDAQRVIPQKIVYYANDMKR